MRKAIKSLCINVFLMLLSALLFALSHPNILSHNGFSFLAFFSFIPLFIFIDRISFRFTFLWGGLYGFFSYLFFVPWLLTFNSFAMPVIAILYFFYLGITFVLMKLAIILFHEYGYVLQWIIWCAYEYMKTLGFTGFSYGIIGYTQWKNPMFLNLSSIFGIWLISAFIVFPSAWISKICIGSLSYKKDFYFEIKKHLSLALVWCCCMFAVFLLYVFSNKQYEASIYKKIALIQPNIDPWKGGNSVYRKNFNDLKILSEKAIRDNHDIDLVVWPETAFIPRIKWHYKFRENYESYLLVKDLLEFIDSQNMPFLIGNDEGVYDIEKADGSQLLEAGRIDYNAVLLFLPKINVLPPNPQTYYKMRLVPFTEYFPFKKILPNLHQFLIEHDTHFWNQGVAKTVFNVNDLKFAVPICFEDTFGYWSRDFVQEGSRLLINISNDAWSKSVVCQYQHLSMSVFRAAETRLPMVRASSSGQTCFINRKGKIVKMLQPCAKDFLIANVPVIETYRNTVYTVIGDILGIIFVVISVCFLLIGILKRVNIKNIFS